MGDLSFSDIVGQEQAVSLLQQVVSSQRIAPAYLFVGIPGIGKKIAARAMARSLLGCSSIDDSLDQHPDSLWIEPTYSEKGNLITVSQAKALEVKKKTAPKIRIEQVRQITQFLQRQPLKSDRLVVIVEDAHLMSEAPANALLKTLEEPGKGTIILTAPSTDSLLTTIVSRCQTIRFIPLSQKNLQLVLKNKNYAEILEDKSLLAVAEGSPGKAILAWQQLQTIPADLQQKTLTIPSSKLEALMIAKTISQEIELDTQLWLIDYLQHHYWQQNHNSLLVHQWEKTRQYLLGYVQPRLAWECLLMALVNC